jgi:23S rRNA pseudouridine1911/1915/1917 synthase
MNIPVVYEDNWLLVLDKPSGLLVIPAANHQSRTLNSILNDNLKERGLLYRLHPCHRLDRETSGLIIYAKGKSAQQKMMLEFKSRRVRKTYVVFAQGLITRNQGEIKNPIEGLPALTRYRVIERKNSFSVVQVMPLTGRTNQIRIHFKLIGHPIVGETKYAFRKDFKLRAKRLCLHAARLGFQHPFTAESISLEAKLPSDMQDFLEKK